MDEYLPPDTLSFCQQQLNALGFPEAVDGRQFDEHGQRIHHQAYLQLRAVLREHIEQGLEPALRETEKPRLEQLRDRARVQHVFGQANIAIN